MRCRSVSLSCKGKINHLIRLPILIEETIRYLFLHLTGESSAMDVVADDSTEQSQSAGLKIGGQLGVRARRMLEAAQRVVDRDGADLLTLRSVAREANESPSLVLYHFESMSKLEAMLLDSWWHDIDVEFLESIKSMPEDAAQRIDKLIAFHKSIAADPRRYQRYFELVSGVIRRPEAMAEIAVIYRSYRTELNAPLLTNPRLTPGETDALAALVLATAEGLPFLRLLNPESFQENRGFDLLSNLLKQRLASGVEREPGQAKPLSPALRAATVGTGVHKTATRLLDAGHSILQTSGLRGLSLESLAKESGEARPAVGYHFGNKTAFVDALALNVLEKWSMEITTSIGWPELFQHPNSSANLASVQAITTKVIQIFPVIQRRKLVHQAAATAYMDAQKGLAERIRPITDSRAIEATGAADICIAALTGLALQKMYDPAEFDPAPSLEQLAELLR